MKQRWLVLPFCSLIFFSTYFVLAALDEPSRFNWKEAKKRCSEKPNNENIVYGDDFSWGITKEEMKNSFNRTYKSGKRLSNRAYYSKEDKTFVVPHFSDTKKKVRLPKNFIKSVTYHIEKALERKYVDFIFLSDMGHAHFFIPTKFYNQKLSIQNLELFYEAIISNPNIKVLYHTAEKLKMLDKNHKVLNQTYAQRRYYTRNLVGNNNADGQLDIVFVDKSKKFNTVNEYPKMKYWGAGFDIHSSSKGCFPYNYKGKTYYFDFTLTSLPYKASLDDDRYKNLMEITTDKKSF